MINFCYGEKRDDVQYVERNCCYGVCMLNDEIMLVYSEKDNNYSLPGGGKEDGETDFQGLTREFLEETGYKVERASVIAQVKSYTKNKKGIYIDKFAKYFVVNVVTKMLEEPIENWHRVEFFELDKALEILRNDQKVQFLFLEEYIKEFKEKE